MTVERLLTWHNRSSRNSRFIKALEVCQSHGGLGIRTNRHVSRLQNIIKVPACCWREFSADRCVQEAKKLNPSFHKRLCEVTTSLVPSSSEQSNDLLRASCMAMKLIIDNKDSLKSPYIDFLYENTSLGSQTALPHPLRMTSEQFAGTDFLLAGSNSYRAISKRRAVYHYIGLSMFGGDVSTIDEFKWAMGIVLSRAISNVSIGTPLTLVPVIDLVNHSTIKCNANHTYDAVTGDFTLYTTKDVEEGEEIFINYGDGRDSASFMSLYGFCDVDNLNDEIPLKLSSKHQTAEDFSGDAISLEKAESFSSFSQWKNLTAEKYKVGITTAESVKKSTSTIPRYEYATIITIGTSTTIPLHFLQSFNRAELESIVEKLLEKKSGSREDAEQTISLCEQVASATYSALGKCIFSDARAVAESHASAVTFSAGVVSEADLVETEIFAAKIVLESIDESITNMLTAETRAVIDRLPDVLPDSISMYRKQGLPSLISHADNRLLYLKQIAVSDPLKSTVSASEIPWRRSCAAISSQELDGLIRLRLLCTAFHIALLTTLI